MTFAKLTGGAALALLAVLALAVVTGCATSKSPLASASPIEKEFAAAAITWDLNRDGDVTCEEWKQYATQLFREADRNRDGFLNKEEYTAMSRTDRLFETAGFNYFDADGDGRISLAELTDKPNPAFVYLDRNHDCVIGPDERSGERRSPGSDGAAKGKGKRGSKQ
jgi:EF hand